MRFIDGDFFQSLTNKALYSDTHEIHKNIIGYGGEYIITHNSDSCLEYIGNDQIKVSVTLTHWNKKAESKLGSRYKIINIPKNLKKWYGQNLISNGDERLVPLPIGLERRRWSKGLKHTTLMEKINLQKERNTLLYINYNEKNHITRGKLKDGLSSIKDIKVINNKINFNQYCDDILTSKYVLSPIGNGLDCHRTWESLYLGAIPIIETNEYYKTIYSDMPVLLIDNYKSLTTEFLEDEYNKILKKEKNKLNQQYWINQIVN